MDDKESKTPWDELAQELGADPSSDAFERSQPPAVEIPAAEDSSTEEEHVEAFQQAPSDWGALADSLGLEVPEPEEPVDEPVEEAVEVVAESLPQESATLSESEEASDSDDDEKESFDAGFGIGIGDDFGSDIDEDVSEQAISDSLPPLPDEVDEIMSEGGWQAEQDPLDDSELVEDSDLVEDSELVDDSEIVEDSEIDNSDSGDEAGMTGEAARNAFDALFTASGSAVALPPSEPSQERRSFDFEEADESLDPMKKAEDSEGEEEERPKRKRSRRRRRGRGGRKKEAEQTTSEEKTLAEDASDEGGQGEDSEKDSSEDEEKPRRRRSRRRSRRSSSSEDKVSRTDSDEPELSDEEILSGSRGGSGRDRTGHRNMPTWEEALSVIVDANVENHSKAPSKPSSPRGRGRGGRRKRKS